MTIWHSAAVIAVLSGLPLPFVTASAESPAGKSIYMQACLACHGADGAGMMPGVPDFSEALGVLTKPDAELLQNMIAGIQSPGSPMAMPPKGGNPALTEAELKEALAYIRSTFVP